RPRLRLVKRSAQCPLPSAQKVIRTILGTGYWALGTSITEDLLEPLKRPFNVLPLTIDLVGPAAELVVRDRRRLIEMFLVEKDAAQNAAEDSDRAVMRRSGALEKRLMPRAGTSIAPEHAAVGVDVAECHAGRSDRLGVHVRNCAHVCRPHWN